MAGGVAVGGIVGVAVAVAVGVGVSVAVGVAVGINCWRAASHAASVLNGPRALPSPLTLKSHTPLFW